MTVNGRGGPCHRGKGGEDTVLRGAVFNSEAPGDGPYPGDKSQGRGGWDKWVRERYRRFFDELGAGPLGVFDQLLEQVSLAVTTATSDDVNLLAKLFSIKSARASVDVVAKYYSRFLPPVVVNNLRADLEWVLSKAEEVVVHAR